MDEISAVMNPFPHTAELVGGEREVGGVRVAFRSSEGASTTRSMLRELAFDVCAMPIVNYLSAREHGLDAVGIPVFLTRRFPQAMLVCDRTQVSEPGDLEGKRVGIGYYGNTDSTWVRGMLALAGVDLDRITWVASSAEQVHGVVLPPNVEPYRQEGALGAYSGVPGSELDELLLDGKLAAVIYGRGERVYGEGQESMGSDRFGPLYGDIPAAEEAWYRSTGLFPILSTLVMRASVLDAHPDLAGGLLELFGEAKEHALRRIEEGRALDEAGLAGAQMSGFPAAPLAESSRAYLGRDPLPYGVEQNRATLEAIVRFAYDQHVLGAAPEVDAVFAP